MLVKTVNRLYVYHNNLVKPQIFFLLILTYYEGNYNFFYGYINTLMFFGKHNKKIHLHILQF